MRAIFIVWIAATIAGVLAMVGGVYTLMAGCYEITFSWSRLGGRSGLLALVCLDGPAQPGETSFAGTFAAIALIVIGLVLLLPAFIGVVSALTADDSPRSGVVPTKGSRARRFPDKSGEIPSSLLRSQAAKRLLEDYWWRVDAAHWEMPPPQRRIPSLGSNSTPDEIRAEASWWSTARQEHQRIWGEVSVAANSGTLAHWSEQDWALAESTARRLYCYQYYMNPDKADRLRPEDAATS